MPSKSSAPLYLFTGDFYLRRKKIDALIHTILPKGERSLHLLRIDLKETSIQNLILQARSFPMLGEKQIFWIENLKELHKDGFTYLEEYFKQPADWSYFILEADKLEEGSAVLKFAAKYGNYVECAENEKRSGIDMIHRKLKSENRTITKEAWQYLEEKTGGNLMFLDSCVDKLLLYTEANSVIELEAAKKLADEFLAYDTFDLTNAICDKKPEVALKIFRFLYDLEGSGIAVIGLINWQLKRIWQAKLIREERGEHEMQRILRISPYRMPYFLKQVSYFSFPELEKAIRTLLELDWTSKTGAFNDRIALESFLIELASPKEKKVLLGGMLR